MGMGMKMGGFGGGDGFAFGDFSFDRAEELFREAFGSEMGGFGGGGM